MPVCSWGRPRMANILGKAYAINVLTLVRRWKTPALKAGFDGRLATRRRILRRSLAYGPYAPEGVEVDPQPRGIIFMAVCASLSRQFELVQQQWGITATISASARTAIRWS